MKQETVLMSDEAIVELYFKRDERAISETDRKYKSYLLTIADNILHNRLDSEECLNDTYIGTWNAIPPERPRILQAFLAVIMRRCAINRYKSDRREKRIPSELVDSLSEIGEFSDEEDILTELQAEDLRRLINDFVSSLPKRRRYVFMSRYYFSRPISEVARLLACSESTVHKEIAKIKKELKEKLEGEGYTV